MDEAEADTPGSPYSQAAIAAREAKDETGDPPDIDAEADAEPDPTATGPP